MVEPSARRHGKKRKETNGKVFAEEVVGDGFETAQDLARVIDLRDQGTTCEVGRRACIGAGHLRRDWCHRRSDEHRKEESEHSEHDEPGHAGCSCDSGVVNRAEKSKRQTVLLSLERYFPRYAMV
jgi:hypothetical protein